LKKVQVLGVKNSIQPIDCPLKTSSYRNQHALMSYIRLRSVKFIRLQHHWKKHSAPSAEGYTLDARAEKLLLAEVHSVWI
jgi:hypothetical protein